MAVKLLQLLVLGVIAAAADDVTITWWSTPRASLPCVVPDAEKFLLRRPPPPLEADDKSKSKPYLWRRDGEEFKRVSSNGTLEVSRRKGSDGVYQCAVRYHGGLVLGYPLHLKFAFIDKYSVHPANATARRGQPHVLTCDVKSGPPAVVDWLRDEKPLPEDTRYYLLNNQLIITDVQNIDAGLYRCKATNTYTNETRISHVSWLQVEDSPGDLEAAILPVQYEEKLVVARGSRVVLPCPVVGLPRPNLIWELTQPGSRTSELEATDEVLVMPHIELDQEGVYVCKVEGNSDLTKTFNVTIMEAVVITVPPTSKQSILASTVRFNCTAVGKPAPTISWYKDGRKLTLAGRILLLPSADGKRLELLIRSVTSEDAGVYQCFARNAASVSSAWASLNVTGAGAEAPGSVRCLPAGARSVIVRWARVPEDMAYTVQTTMPGGTSLPGPPVKDNESNIIVKSPLTPYGFQVRAYIRSSASKKDVANVISNMSESVTCQGQGVPIKLAKLDEDAILVSWKQFSTENPGVMQWILQFKAENSSDEHNVTLDGHIDSYNLEVSPKDPVQVRVLGSRTLPWVQQNLTLVPWTSTSTASHDLDGGEVKAVAEDVEVTEVSSESFTVRWHCEEADASPEMYTFRVCTRKVDGNEDCQESLTSSVTVENLEPNSQYEVRVQVRLPGRALDGDFSSPIHVSTLANGPQRFGNITYKFINATTLRISWVSVPDRYTVHYSNEYNLPLNQWASVETIGNTVLLTGLDLTKELYVTVTEYEPESRSSIMTVPIQIPEAKDLQYSFTGSGVRVRWSGPGPRVVRYSQNLTQPLDKWLTINVTQTSVQITGLDPSQPTFVMVAAPGPSQRSQVLTIERRPTEGSNIYLVIGTSLGVCLLGLLVVAAVCIWQRRKRSRSPFRSHQRPLSPTEGNEAEGSEMKNIGGRLANGSLKDAGEPLLNGHVHITENPTQSKTPNGRMGKGRRYEAAFDVARYDEADTTLETVLDTDTSASTAFNLLDTSRRPEYDVSRSSGDASADNSFTKLPDDNMNSELARAVVDNSKIQPMLQPNG